jgi:hypothetical protein
VKVNSSHFENDPLPEIDRYYEANKDQIAFPREQAASQILEILKREKLEQARHSFLEGLEKTMTPFPAWNHSGCQSIRPEALPGDPPTRQLR